MRLLALALTPMLAMPALAQSQAELGEQNARRCLPCHAVGEGAANKIGPQLNGVVGRPVAGLDTFAYSQTLQQAGAAGMAWTPELLTQFLKNPRHVFPGTSMNFAGMRERADIDSIIAYLATFAADGTRSAP